MVIAGGGTGGHLYPGIAVAKVARDEGSEVLFIGAEGGIETRVLPREGFKLTTVRAGKFKGAGVMGKLLTIALLPVGVTASLMAIRRFRPQVVMGVGGYASFPAVAAAKLSGLPVVVQEQNAFPGLANRTLGRFADKVALGFEEAKAFFPRGRTAFTGNPVRQELLHADRASARARFGLHADKTTVLIFGGSAGAHSINRAVADSLAPMGSLLDGLQFIHQTGEKDLEMVEAAYRQAGAKASVLPYIYDMAGAYASADLVICRSGALTLAELTAVGKPAVLIPYPHAANNHQEVNARVVEKAGAARVVKESDATGERLASEIAGMVEDNGYLAEMSSKSLALGRPDAARAVYEICRGLAGE